MDGGEYSPRAVEEVLPCTVEEIFLDFKGRRAGLIKALTTDAEECYQQCDPALGINFARDDMPEKDWLSLVAVHSDARLLSVAFYFGARVGFHKTDRKRLFNMISDLPTVFDVVTGTAKKHSKEKPSNHSSSKSKSDSKVVKEISSVLFCLPFIISIILLDTSQECISSLDMVRPLEYIDVASLRGSKQGNRK